MQRENNNFLADIDKTKIIVWVFVISLLVLVGISWRSYYEANNKIDIYLNKLYLDKKSKEHILICSLDRYNDDSYEIVYCKNTFRFTSGTIIDKDFFSIDNLKRNYLIESVTEYHGTYGRLYIIGWFEIPSKDIIEEITKVFNINTNSLKYIDKVFNYVFD